MAKPFGRQVSIPLSQIRLTFSVFTAFSFGFLLYIASVNLKWLTLSRALLILVGVLFGLLLGWLEARTVTRGLKDKEQTIIWQVLAATIAIVGVPLLFAKFLLDGSEFLPFAGYLFLPAVPAFGFSSGWKLRVFEQRNNVQVRMLSFGYSYYKEPVIVDTDRFSTFMGLVASRDGAGLWQQIGYTKKLRVTLESNQDIAPTKKQQLLSALRTMARYRRLALIALSSIIIVGFSVLVVSCSQMFGGPVLLNNSSINILMPILAVYFVMLVAGVFLMMRMFNSKIAAI
jgi:hypothetical protein